MSEQPVYGTDYAPPIFHARHDAAEGDSPEFDETGTLHLGNPVDDDADVFAGDFVEVNGGPLDKGVEKDVPVEIKPPKRQFLRVARITLNSSTLPTMLVPFVEKRTLVTIVADAAGCRVAEDPGDLSQAVPIPPTTNGGSLALPYNGPVYIDAPAAAGTVNVCAYSVIEA